MSVSAPQNSTSAAANLLTGGGSAQSLQNQFLTLLVTQMQNQDPMNPMDNSQVTSQMAQLSTVTGIDNLNTSMNSLSSTFLSTQMLQSAGLIGKNVLTQGNSMALNGTASFGVDLPQAVDNLTVSILDSSGNTVRTLSYGSQAAGTLPLQWDGLTNAGTQAPNGAYTFSVKASQGGNSVAATPLAEDVVSSVSQNSQGVLLNLSSGGQVGLSGVKLIL